MPDIYKIIELLGIDVKDIAIYFFTLKVEKIQQNQLTKTKKQKTKYKRGFF